MRNNQVSSLADGRIGTFDYCAPEVLLNGRACEKADIFSFGVILAEIVTGGAVGQ
jgi:serine/threonine protein kinase